MLYRPASRKYNPNMEAAKLPEALLQPRKRRLKELQPGEEMTIPFPLMRIDSDKRCYLDPESQERTTEIGEIRVRRDSDGGYHVEIPEDLTMYEPKEIEVKSALYPVASISLTKSRWSRLR